MGSDSNGKALLSVGIITEDDELRRSKGKTERL